MVDDTPGPSGLVLKIHGPCGLVARDEPGGSV